VKFVSFVWKIVYDMHCFKYLMSYKIVLNAQMPCGTFCNIRCCFHEFWIMQYNISTSVYGLCVCLCVCVCVCSCALVPKFIWQQDSLVVANIALFKFKYTISVGSVDCIIKEIRPTIHSFYCIHRDSSYIFRLCNVAIISPLISEV
jgi:hypothetical protein